MAKLALAVGVGALGGALGVLIPGAGFALGAEIGLAIGGVLGGVLFPGKLPPGPRLQDLQVTSATDGAPIPFGYGINRVAGQLIWSSGIQEHAATQSVKGGTQQTTFTYTTSFAVAFGEGPAKLGRIWFDSKIAYDPAAIFVPITSVNGQTVTCSLHPSVGAQVCIAGVVPTGGSSGGFDGIWSVTFSTPTFFVVQNGSATGTGTGGTAGSLGNNPTGSVITAINIAGSLVTVTSTLNPVPGTQVTIFDVTSSKASDGTVNPYNGTVTVQSSTSTFFTYFSPHTGMGPGTGGIATLPQPRYAPPTIYSGTEIQNADPTIQAAVGAANCPAFRGLCYAVWSGLPLQDFANRLPNVRAEITYQSKAYPGFGTFETSSQDWGNSNPVTTSALAPASSTSIALWAISAPGISVASGWVDFGAAIGLPALLFQIQPQTSLAAVKPSVSGTGRWASNLLIFANDGVSLTSAITQVTILNNVVTCKCASEFIVGTTVKFSNLVGAAFLNGQSLVILSNNGSQFTVAFSHGNYGPTADSGTATNFPFLQSASFGAINASGTFTATFTNPVKAGSTIMVVGVTNDLNAIITLSSVNDNQGGSYTIFNSINQGGSIPPNRPSSNVAFAQNVAGGSTTVTAVLTNVAASFFPLWAVELPGGMSTSSSSYTLPGIVADISMRSGLLSTDINTTLLNPIAPPAGYVVSRPTTAQSALKPLAMAFFFDGVESGGVIKYVPRGAATQSLVIPETDLGRYKDNYKLTESISQAQDLPREIQVMFNDPALDYQQNKTQKRRHTRIVRTKNQSILELAMAIDSTTARQIAEKTLFLTYLERHPYDLNLWKALYLLFDPTDIISFTYEGLNFIARITKSSIGLDFTSSLTMVNENVSSYQSIVVGSSGTGVTPAKGVFTPSTTLFLYDIPLLRDVDSNPSGSGYYYAMSSPSPSQWSGAVLYNGSDNINFSEIATDSIAVQYGTALSLLGPPLHSPWVWDNVNTLTFFLTSGSLAGTSDINVLNGANALLVGNEVVQYVNAVQNADTSWTISRLLRGRRGTEVYCNSHSVGEGVVNLIAPGVVRQPVGTSSLQVQRYYRAVTIGLDISQVASQTFTIQGQDLMPYAVTSVIGSRDLSFNLMVSWIRRTRIGGDWLEGIGVVPLSEAVESYDVDILRNGAVVRTLAALSSPTFAYTAAQQTSDFGSPQTSISMNIYQNSAAIGRGFAKSVIV